MTTSTQGGQGNGPKSANADAAAREAARKERLKNKAKNNKGCQQKKGTSKSNRQKVNEKKNGSSPACEICGRTAKKSALDRIKKFQAELPGTKGKARKELQDRIKRWERRAQRNKLEADHKFPSSKIKEDKGFKELEVANPDAARAIMHDQANMRGLCRSCNGGLGAKSGFQGKNIREKIRKAVREAYKS